MEVRDKLYIGGAWVPSTGKGVIEVVNSATEEVIGTIPEGTPEDVDRAAALRGRRLPGVVGDVDGRAGQDPGARPGGADGAHRGDRHADLPGSRDALHAVQPHPGRAARDELRGRRAARHRVPLRGGGRATRSSSASRSVSWGPSRRGTTRCTRSPPRSPRRSPRAAPWCSSRARWHRSTPSSWPRSSTTSASRRVCSTS